MRWIFFIILLFPYPLYAAFAPLAPTRIVYSVSTDTASLSDGLIEWQSFVPLPKTENIGLGGASGQILGINDGCGNASAYPITLTGVNGATIGGNLSLVMNSNFFTIYLVWDGISNWTIVSYDTSALSAVGYSFLITNNGQLFITQTNQYIRLNQVLAC